MITDFVLTAIFAGINALLSLMPSFSLSPPGSSFSPVLFDVEQVNNIVPITAIFDILSILILLKIALTAWDFILFVYHQFWGSD